MSRISITPGSAIPFRFYMSDNWFAVVPWYDYYDREPFDIYCPNAVCRLTARGEAETATDVLLFTVNTGFGEMFKSQATEIVPCVRRAIDMAPDQAGPLVWVYPFSEYQDECHKAKGRLEKPFFGDWYAAKSIAAGLPLNTVMATENLLACLEENPSALAGRVCVAPTPSADWDYAAALLHFARNGGQVLFYGSLHDAPKSLLKALNVRIDTPIDGNLDVNLRMGEDPFDTKPRKRCLRHIARLCDGGVTEVLARKDDTATTLRAIVRQGHRRRIYALVRKARSWKGGQLGWIRGTLPFSAAPDSLEPKMFSGERLHNAGFWMRYLLRDFGFNIEHHRHDAAARTPYLFISRRRGAYVFTGHAPDCTATTRLSFPDGAPLLDSRQTRVRRSMSTYTLSRWFIHECHACVRQERESFVSHSELRTVEGETRAFRVSGLKEATVTLYVPPEAVAERSLKVRKVMAYVIHDPTVSLKAKGFDLDENGWPIEPLLDYEAHPVSGAAVLRCVSGSIDVRY